MTENVSDESTTRTSCVLGGLEEDMAPYKKRSVEVRMTRHSSTQYAYKCQGEKNILDEK